MAYILCPRCELNYIEESEGYCKICKQTTCKENVTFADNPNLGFRIDEVRFFAKGICENCLDETLQ